MQLPLRFRRAPVGGTSALPAASPRPAVLCLLAAPLLAGAAQLLARRFAAPGADPLLAFGALSAEGWRAGRVWQLWTHLFLTSSPGAWTLAATLALVYLAGRPLESLLGARHVLGLYALAGLVGALGQLGFDGLSHQPAPYAGAAAPALAFCLAAACLAPDAPLLPGWRRLRVWHLALAAVAVLGAALWLGEGAVRPVVGPQLVRALLGGLTGCLYARAVSGAGLRVRFTRSAASLAPPPVPPNSPSSAAWVGQPPAPPAVLTAPPSSPAAGTATLAAPRFTERERRMSAREFVAEQADPILEKIARHGLASLSADERRLLDKAREKLAGQGS